MVVSIVFFIHWIACGYRLVADPQSPSDPQGWLHAYMDAKNLTSISPADAYFGALYWSASTLTLVGIQNPNLAPSCTREYIYAIIVTIIGFLIAINYIAKLVSLTLATGETAQEQEIIVDNYLEMFDNLRLDPRLKFTVTPFFNS